MDEVAPGGSPAPDAAERALREAVSPTVPGQTALQVLPPVPPTVIRADAPSEPTGPVAAVRAPTRLGPYLLLSELGRGGMGAVYLALEEALSRKVALKVMLPRFAENPASVERFYREARASAALQSPHIVSVLGFGESEGMHYYAMEYVEGRSASELLRQEPVSQERAALVVLQAARGLALAHEKGIVHRDVKPQNLMVTWRRSERPDLMSPRERVAAAQAEASWQARVKRGGATMEGAAEAQPREDLVKVADFGLVRVDDAMTLTQSGAAMGTPVYMPPEQFAGARGVGPPGDVYSLGVTLYEMLTGRPPFWGADLFAIQRRVEEEDPIPPRKLVGSVDRDLEAVTLKCLEKDPARRYAQAGALAEDLSRWLSGSPVKARRVSRLGRAWRTMVRRRRVVLPIAAALLLSIALGAWVTAGAVRNAAQVGKWMSTARRCEAEGDRTGSKQAYEDAKAALTRVLGASGDHEEAQVALARVQRRLDEAEKVERTAREEAQQGLARTKEALEKTGPVSEVLEGARSLGETFRRMEEVFYDDALTLAQKRERNGPAWNEVATWMKATSKDPSAQATVLAFAGWARRLAGYEEEGLGFMRQGMDLDADIPYAALLRAMMPFSRYVELQDLPDVVAGGWGVAFGPMPSEGADRIRLREEVERALAGMGEALVWGGRASEANRSALDGITAMRRGEFEAAEEALTRAAGAVDLRLIRTSLLWSRASVRFLRKDFQGAIEDMTQVRDARRGQARVWFGLAMMRKTAADVCSGTGRDLRGDYLQAIAEFGEALSRDPGDVQVVHHRGSALLALAESEVAQGLDPRESLRKALDDFARALSLSPGYVPVYNSRGWIFVTLGNAERGHGEDPSGSYRGAIVDFGEAIRREPDDVKAYSNRGCAIQKLGEWEQAQGRDPRARYLEAIADQSEALKRDPESGQAHQNRGNAYASLAAAERWYGEDPRGSYRRAIADFDEVLKRYPDYIGAYYARGNAHLLLGRAVEALQEDPRGLYERAAADFDDTLERNPELSSAYNNRGMTWMFIGDRETALGEDARASYRKAINDFGEAIQRHPGPALSYSNRGNVFWKLGQAEEAQGVDPRDCYRKAIPDCDAALARDPSLWRMHATKGLVFEAMGEAARAVECYERALAIVGDSQPSIRESLARARQAAGSVGQDAGWAEFLGRLRAGRW